MRSPSLRTLFLLSFSAASVLGAEEKGEPAPLPTVAEKMDGLSAREGLLTFFVDEKTGGVLALLPPPDVRSHVCDEFIYVESLASGLGSNRVGLDRGQLGGSALIRFVRIGPKVLIERVNQAYRALSHRDDETRAVEQSFASSILWGGSVAALDPDGRSLVDLSSFLLRDAHGVVGTLRDQNEGAYQLDAARSVIDASQCFAFPDNVEFEVLLTYETKGKPGREASGVTPDRSSFSLRQHHSFIKVPDAEYVPRAAHPASGYGTVSFLDYAAPLDGAMRKNWITRHRLQKVDPTRATSRVLKPIVYYVDRGAPPRIRDALIEGASWWSAAFEAAGFRDAFRVELLPDGVHPLDVRYHVIHWVHRSTRGWSYGDGITDPRTGEILKGNVLLGSLRVRQDRLLFEGMLGTSKSGSGDVDDPVELALARVRQLAAHEVGHTLGLSHNFAASTYGRASVMDYPAPLLTLDDRGEIDASSAYATGVGAWDVQAIRYGYTEFASDANEAAELLAIVTSGRERGLAFLTDADARPLGSAHPLANLWDNGADPVLELTRLLAVRQVAIDRFGANNLPVGRPVAELQEVFVPVYLHHRYQIAAAAKVLGGVEYGYELREADGDVAGATPVAAERQVAALDALLEALDAERLDVPDRVVRLLLPRPPGVPPSGEGFRGQSSPTFDALGAARTAANLVIDALLDPARATRLVEQHLRDPMLPGLDLVCNRLIDAAFSRPSSARRAAIEEGVAAGVVERLIGLSLDANAPLAVRATAEASLLLLHQDRLPARPSASSSHLSRLIELYFARTLNAPPPTSTSPKPPAGDPIGADCGAYFGEG